ncbi:hypothetical protein HK098_001476 [Nowakowskiella sp. JEL0407]|nr:hypothetical protein HK098_001476 [Nowakowskiella sp. JEL0407]
MAATVIPLLTYKFGKKSFTIPRYSIIILFVCLALFIGYSHRNVVSVSKIAIADEFGWTQFQESQFVASYYYGYIVPQIMIGIACQLWGGKWLLAVGIGMSSVFTFLAPFTASTFWLLILDRVLTGFFQGAALPATTSLYARWIPREKYSLATGIQYSGMYLGTAFTNGIYSTIRDSTMPNSITNWGWQGSYYLFAVLGFGWFLFFIVFAASGPEEYEHEEVAHMHLPHKHHAHHQPDQVIHGQHMVLEAHKPPPTLKFILKLFGKLLGHRSSIVFFVCHFCSNWSMYLLMGYVPSFLVCILGLDKELSSLFGFLPYLFLYFVLLISSFSADRLITAKTFSKTTVRKIMVAIGFGLPASCLVGLAFIDSQLGGSILLVLGVAFSGAAIPGFFPLPLDLSKDYAGLIISLSNTLATVAGIAAPLFTGAVLTGGNCKSKPTDGLNPQCRSSWQIVLLVSAAVYFVGIVVMTLFGSAEEVDWDVLVNGVSSKGDVEGKQIIPKQADHEHEADEHHSDELPAADETKNQA